MRPSPCTNARKARPRHFASRCCLGLLALGLYGVSGGGAACSTGGSTTVDGGADAGLVDWVVDVDPAAAPLPSGVLDPALLGQYDLSGALFSYDQIPGLVDAMKTAGFSGSDWRVGVERWEIGTLLFPTLTDGTPCPIYSALPAAARAPFADDAALAKARDWFVDDGAPVTEPMTADDGRYALAYVRRAVDVALAFGAKPYVDIDAMPRALSVNRTFARDTAALSANDACSATFTNHVTNAAPANASVFAAAVTGLVRRVVEGSGGEPGRPVTRWELWNEPEWAFFWDKAFEPNKNLDAFFGAMTAALFRLDAYRKSSPAASALRFGLGSFASADTAAKVLTAYDGKGVPIDFVSFHAYDNDPLVIVAQLAKVASARATTKDYKSVELVLAEWGPQLDGKGWDPATMDVPLLVSTVIALGAPLGVARMHHALFWDYYDVGVRYGLLDHGVKPKPLHSAYSLLARAIGAGASRLAPKGLEDGRIDGGTAAVLASKDGSGKVHVLVINRGAAAKDVELRIAGVAAGRTAVSRLEGQGITTEAATSRVRVGPRSIVLLEP